MDPVLLDHGTLELPATVVATEYLGSPVPTHRFGLQEPKLGILLSPCLQMLTKPTTMVVPPASSEAQMVQSLGFAIYRALDWGLDESEERELSPQLERLIDLMANSDCDDGGCGTADEGYGGPEEEEEAEGGPRTVRTFARAMQLCAARLTEPQGAQAHYQAVCRALFVETLELRAFLARVREAKEMLQRLGEDEPQMQKPLAELDNLGHTDWARLWVQLMRELRHGVKLKKVQEQEFNPLPTEFQLTPFEMLMQDIRARNYKLRKVMVGGDIAPRVKKDAHELILDFIRSRPPLKQMLTEPPGSPPSTWGGTEYPGLREEDNAGVRPPATTSLQVSERRLRPLPQKQRTLHERILEEIKQERKLRPVGTQRSGTQGFGSLPCILNACSGDIKSTSCINLSVTDVGSSTQRSRPRVLLKAPTLAEMEEMNTSEAHSWFTLGWTLVNGTSVLVTAVVRDYFLRAVCTSCSIKMKMPSKKCAHIPVYTLGFESPQRTPMAKATPMQRREVFQSLQGPRWRSVEEEFPHIYAHGCILKDVCSDCTSFVADVVLSSRRSVDALNATPRRSRQTQSLYLPDTKTLDFK
ncbi:Protein spire like protein 2 [Fukomys damarensis]|uniref:Protein spire like protein 2 n=1 Tax=Fukomys damarensis TaxID=885580 RepID=A0A091DNM1_FUKDA|nr:Protein spire like protein 2 [Fukomys damarensis]